MTPGSYIRDRREAIGWSIEQVACCLGSEPAVNARTRGHLLEEIESGDTHVCLSDAYALSAIPQLGIRLDFIVQLMIAQEDHVDALRFIPAPTLAECR